MYNLQPEENRKSTRRGCVNMLAVVGAITIAFCATAFGLFLSPVSPSVSTASSSAGGHPPSARNDVVYKIRFDTGVSNSYMDSCAEFSTTYAMPNGTAQEDAEACIGVNYVASFQGNRGDHLYLSIQNTAPKNSSARFSCMITVDGKTVAEVESIGWPSIASCSTSIP